MRTADIFLSFEGRLDRERWLGATSLLVALVVATYGATWLLARNGWLPLAAREAARAFAQIALLVPWFALDWKRFQDLDRSGRWAIVCPSLVVIGRALDWPWVAARLGTAHETVHALIAWSQLAVAVWLAALLPWRAGTVGPNRFGPDPRGRARIDAAGAVDGR